MPASIYVSVRTQSNAETPEMNEILSPKFATVDGWQQISGMPRRTTYEHLGRGNLRAIKVGARTLIDVASGLAWLSSLPQAQVAFPRIPGRPIGSRTHKTT
jgi:hypothetical protein